MKRIILLILSFILTVTISGCGSTLSEISKRCKAELDGGRIITDTDTHGGFNGDGCTFVVAEYSDDAAEEKIADNGNWKSFPLSDSLNEFVYGMNIDEIDIPEIENGYYYFYDRHSESTNHDDDTQLNDRYSYNFTLAIYDTDTDRLYYIEFDT